MLSALNWTKARSALLQAASWSTFSVLYAVADIDLQLGMLEELPSVVAAVAAIPAKQMEIKCCNNIVLLHTYDLPGTFAIPHSSTSEDLYSLDEPEPEPAACMAFLRNRDYNYNGIAMFNSMASSFFVLWS